MKRFVCLMVTLLASFTWASAADPKPLTRTGDKALLFDLGGLANLAAGNYGGGLGFRYYIGSDLALRLSVGFNTSSETTKNTASPLPANQLAESELTHTGFTLAPAITYTIAKSSAVAAYVGGMVSFISAIDKREGNSGGLGVGFDSGEAHRVSTTEWGFAGILGVEWWPWENISFSGEYRLGYSHSAGERESTTPAGSLTTDSPTTNGFGLGSANSGALTLAVYF
jgi:hypothetical protein